MAQNVLRYNVAIVGKFFNDSSWVSEAWKKEHPEEWEANPKALEKESRMPSEEKCCALTLFL